MPRQRKAPEEPDTRRPTHLELQELAKDLGIDLLSPPPLPTRPPPPLPTRPPPPLPTRAPPPLPADGPLVGSVRRLYQLVTGRVVSPALDARLAAASIDARERVVSVLDLARRGLAAITALDGQAREAKASATDALLAVRDFKRGTHMGMPVPTYRERLKALKSGAAARVEQHAKLAETRGKIFAQLRRRLAGLDAEIGAILKPVDKGGFYRAGFSVKRDQNGRPTDSTTIRAWATIPPGIVRQMRDLDDGDYHDLSNFDAIAVAFGWGEAYFHWQSGAAWARVDEFEELPEGSHEAGSWDAANVKLSRRGRVQPTLGCPAGRFVKAGSEIARPEFYREDSCMLSLFLETWHGRLKTHSDDLTLEGLYQMATGDSLVEGQPAGVSLREAEAWLEHWRLAGRAINARGELIWKYDPKSASKKVAGGAVWRLLIHDEHVWLCDREVKEFDQAITARDRNWGNPQTCGGAPGGPGRSACDSIPVTADISAGLSSRWRRPPKPTGVPPTFVDSANDVLRVDEDVSSVVTNGRVEALFIALWEAGHEPGSVRLDKGAIDSFTVRVGDGGKQLVRVSEAVGVELRDDQLVSEALTARGQVVFEEHLARGRAAFQPIDGLSTYSDSLAAAFRAYTRGPRVGLLGEPVPKETACVEFDVSRAYTSFLAEVQRVPVFSVFDEVRPYDGSDVEPLAFYLVRVETLDGVLFPRRCDFVPGETVAYARKSGIAVELVGVARPCRLVETNGASVLRALYDDDELSDQARKTTANIFYGLANKGRNRKQVGSCFLDVAEAKAHGGYLKQLGPGYIAVKQGSKDLTEGYLPVGRLVLDAMRRRLHSTVVALGGDAIAVKTDAVFVRAEHGERATAALRAAGFKLAAGLTGWDIVGAMKVNTKPAPELKPLPLDTSPMALRPVAVPMFEDFAVDEEATIHGDWSSVDALMPTRPAAVVVSTPLALEAHPDEDDMVALTAGVLADFAAMALAMAEGVQTGPTRGPIALEALVPGAGKTYLIHSWVERTAQSATAITVSPYNALVSKNLKEGRRSITLHELVGRLAVETEDGLNYKKAYDLQGVTHIFFDEIRLYPVNQLGWIREFMRKHPGITFSNAGDSGQNAPVRQELACDSDAWYDMAIATMFPRRIVLQMSKRVTDPTDRARMTRLCEELREEVRPVADILRDAGLPVVRFESLTEGDARYPHIAAMRSTMAKVDHWAHEAVGETGPGDVYLPGQELFGVDGCRCKGGRIASNETYIVAEADDNGLSLTAPDGSRRIVTMAAARRYLKRPYCRTGHSTQGLSLGDRIYLHDWKSPMATHRWVRTAVSRCSTLDIVLVEGSEGLRNNWRVSGSRIEAHRAADLAKGFVWDPAAYVTSDWVADKLRSQRYSCWSCSEPLDLDWSIDRIANELPHIKSNAAISFRKCQNASAHRD